MTGSGAVLTVDATSSLEIGSAGDAITGEIVVDPGAVLSGAGALDPEGAIMVAGTITASAGTLTLGAISGAGTLLIGVGATLALDAAAASSALIDFAGPGTLNVLAALPAADIADFGDGDAIDLPIAGITSCQYADTGPNLGVLTLFAGSNAVGTLNLVGVGQGQSFAATQNGGGTIITTQTTDWGGGGGNVRNPNTGDASGTFGIVQDYAFWQSLPAEAQNVLASEQAQHGNEAWVDTSTDGLEWDNPAPAVANFAVLSAPTAYSIVGLPLGYSALLAQGTTPVWLTDAGAGDALIVGNQGNDTLSGTGFGDTLVGAGGNTLFFAKYSADIFGAGNDTVITGIGNNVITTAPDARSIVWLGAAQNNVISQGHDVVLAASGYGANDTIWAVQSDTIFGAQDGRVSVVTGNGPSVLIAGAGEMDVHGGPGNGTVFWCGSTVFAQFIGGAGSAEIVGGSGELSVQGGAGALTVYGGTGSAIIQGGAGPSVFVMGDGASTVTAASGNHVWLVGAANDSLIAGGGNIVLNGSYSAGNNIFQAGSGPCTIYGGHGNDTYLGGAGAAIISTGSGRDVFSFTNGLAGGSETIDNFNIGDDRIVLNGYGGYTANLVNGSEVISLSDGTHIQLTGIGSMSGVNIT
jgi:Ca2+-binding RTX toxin-like protein